MEPTPITKTSPAAKRPPVNIRTRAEPQGPPPARRPDPVDHHGTLETVIQAAAELTEIGLRASARALRGAVSRLPHP